ncbi:MAG: DotU family type IV/VI secretion system protein [Alphaproteobacteria bacterium]|nr:DotU family type IV/VI secretion system protein [Alphaproteobacteria bacterium]
MQENANLMYGTDKDSSFIVRYFEDFYGEVIRQKTLVLGQHTVRHAQEFGVAPERIFTPNTTPGIQSDGAPLSHQRYEARREAALPEQIIQRLLTLLNSQSVDAARFGGEFAAKYYIEAQFIMAALADEIFLHMDWHGKDYWGKNLLEDKLYGTHNAGEILFDRIDDFLKVRDPSRADLAMLYLICLGLGFKGKYRHMPDNGKIQHYRRELFIFIYRRDPTLYEMGTTLMPDAYLHTMENGKLVFLNDTQPWIIAYAVLGIVMLLASYMVWHSATHEIDVITDSIIAQTDNREG